jgi:hypothetical protein
VSTGISKLVNILYKSAMYKNIGNDIPVDTDYIQKSDLKRKISEQDLPLRLTITAAEAILNLDNTEYIDFSTFASALVFYNRWFLYSVGFNINNNYMTLQQFLVFLHDKLINNSFRSIIDTIYVNIPNDYVVNAAQEK